MRLSCSPFTFMGEGQQTALRAVQEGRIGRVQVAYTEMNWGGIEEWHADPEGFYRPGDAARLADPREPARGIVFDGRIGENFKLTSGTWVSSISCRSR